MTPALRNRLWLAAALTLTAAKLWLSRGPGVYAIGSAGHDDRLFLELARHLVAGEWLGPYHELTLAKGPFYPLFIAASFLIGLPLFLAQHAFYAAACGAFVRALRPAVTAAGARFAIFALLLWNPMTFDGPSMGRVLRQHVYGPLALLILAGLIALYLRRSEPSRHQRPWAILTGLAAAAFYLTREEVVWLAPSVLLLAAAYVAGCARLDRIALRRAAGGLGTAILAAALPVLAVCTLNRTHYGWFGTSEFHATEFKAAYGAMLRVHVGPERPFVPVSREAREAMAAISPAFAELQHQFDAGLAAGWAGSSSFLTGLPAEEGQIGGGWMIWAVREATAKAGHAASAADALAFYDRLARELNAAADSGRLPAGPPRHGFVPPWRDAQTPAFVRATRDFADFVIRFSRFGARPPPSTGSAEELQLFRDLTRERLSPPAGELDVVGAKRYLLNVAKTDTLHAIGKALRPVLTGLFWLAQLGALVRLGWLVLHRRWTFPFTVAAAAWGAVAASVLMHAMIEASSFPVHTISSFAPVYPLVLVFISAMAWEAASLWSGRGAPAAPAAIPPAGAPEPESESRATRALPWLAGLAALAPFLIWHREFRELFWFGDDFFLLDQLAQMGLWQWTTLVFAENFVPLFKVLWGGAALGFGGSYAAMLWLLWLTHAANTVVLGRLLQRAGFPLLATAPTLLVFALTPANLETLGWSVQWSAVLATSFLLLACVWHERHRTDTAMFAWRRHLPLFLLAAASACSFSRGVLTGAVLSLGLLLPALLSGQIRRLLPALPGALFCLLPAIAVALVIKLNSSGNHQQLAGHWGDILEFGATYFLLNPGHALTGGSSLHPAVLLLLAAGKLAVLAGALGLARGRMLHLLLLLLAYDLGNAVLVGIGRHHTGFLAALSSRYQYSSLLATLPFAGLLLAAGLAQLPGLRLRQGLAAVLLLLIAGLCLRGWPSALADFTGWRGTELRQLIAAPATSDPAARVPALEFMHIERAKALQRAYHLH
ncbi:hypothetical protein Verru16b_02017 [Lacunisphaera limnophila]|uniref:Uncharacterized protein n=1 Tax=Lacunisphaera limnophila TaxID=1838286 RepID=A0A1D8AVM1_9BACT|nr:hypothetical protein [Lacunisphaera limnophila]AOS44948.1 hypothetical protein Verru16b_02017 [Lacunisphaera limnophila]